jgi:hypothetical protein
VRQGGDFSEGLCFQGFPQTHHSAPKYVVSPRSYGVTGLSTHTPCPRGRAVVEGGEAAGGSLDSIAARHDVGLGGGNAHSEAAFIII